MRTATKCVQVTATVATKTLSNRSADNAVRQMIVLRGTSPISTLDISSCAFFTTNPNCNTRLWCSRHRFRPGWYALCGCRVLEGRGFGVESGGTRLGDAGVLDLGAHDSVNVLQDGLADCVDSCPNDANNDADRDGICGDVDR